jgi:hypothetical protein
MSTVEPHTPEPGWLRRWTVQSLQLAPRMGAAAALMAAGVWVVGAVLLLAESVLGVALGDSRLVQDGARTLATPLALPILLSMVALFIQGDQGQRPDWAHVGALLPKGMRMALIVAAGIQIFVLTLLGGWNDPGRPFLDNLGLLPGAEIPLALAAGVVGVDLLASTLAIASFVGVLAVPLVVGMGVGWDQAALFDKRMRAKMPRVNRALWSILLGAAITAVVAGPLVGFVVLFFLVLWLFVAAREIVGGIRSNGTQRATSPEPQVQPSA